MGPFLGQTESWVGYDLSTASQAQNIKKEAGYMSIWG